MTMSYESPTIAVAIQASTSPASFDDLHDGAMTSSNGASHGPCCVSGEPRHLAITRRNISTIRNN